MQRLLPPATLIILLILAAMMACSDPTPAPETVTPTSAPTPTAAPASTDAPVSTETPAERPTAATKATPASTPTPGPIATPAPPAVLAPLQALDISALLSELSTNELACIGDDAGKLVRSLAGPGQASGEEQAKLIRCLEDETVARIFLAGFAPGPGPLSLETSDCVRAGFAVIDPREVMTAGIAGDPGRAMAGSMAAFSVTTACLNDQEWEATASQVGMGPSEREGMRCLLEQLGGPRQMAEVMMAAGEGDFIDLDRAGAACGLDMGLAPGQESVTPPPTPAETVEAPTVVSTPVPATSTSTPVPTGAAPAATLVITVAPIPTDIPKYVRKDWKHWEDHDGDCQDARQEVLIAESLVPVTFETDRKCRVETGRWFGVFTGAYFEDPGDVDVDHMVPLKNAHNSGGWDWSPAMKEEYANNLGDDDHLIAVQDNANQSKGARGPDEWMPPDETYWCQYAQDWAEIKARWKLTMTDPEAESVTEMLGTCVDPPEVVTVVEFLTALGTATGENKPEATEELQNSVYGSCEEAAEAGEQRVQGSQGGGEGFPKAMVPSARDGDGDGVVCER